MRHAYKTWLILGALLVLGTVTAFGQNSLTDNPNYLKALDMQRMAQQSYDAGDYQEAMDYSAQAKELSKVALVEAEKQRMKWMANSYKNRAAERIAFGEKNHAATRYPDIWTQAKASYAVARQTFDAESYQASVDASTKVIDLMAGVEPEQKAAAAPTPVATPVAKPVASKALPAMYEVRLIESARDCFWRIAEYPFVYGDPWKWRLLYEANKDKLPDPSNPDLILSGMLITIPSASGEVRQGIWAPAP
jgi:nucleoid-associated protein YgaU